MRIESSSSRDFLRDSMAAHLADHVSQGPDALVFSSTKGESLRISNWRRRILIGDEDHLEFQSPGHIVTATKV